MAADADPPSKGRPIGELFAWWGPLANEFEQHRLAAAEFDFEWFAARVGFDDEELRAFVDGPTPRRRFLICELLSETRWAWVYVALDVLANRPVVLKISTREVEPEGRTITQLHHPNVVTVHDMFVWEGYPTLVLEWCSRNSLHDYARGADDWRDVLARGLEAGRGLAYCHERGLLHSDIKPTNILIAGNVGKLADFGLARHETRDGHFGGTEGFAPPERALGVLNAAGDVYSFAATLVWALRRHKGVPKEVVALLGTAVTANPERRPSLTRLIADLEHQLDDGAAARLERARWDLERRSRRVFLQTTIVSAIAIVLLGSAGVAAKCMVVPEVEPREPSIERAIELADAGDPIGAMLEYHRIDQEKDHVLSAVDNLRLAESPARLDEPARTRRHLGGRQLG